MIHWRFSGPSSFELIGQGLTVIFGVPGSYLVTASAVTDRGEFPIGDHHLTVSGIAILVTPRTVDLASGKAVAIRETDDAQQEPGLPAAEEETAPVEGGQLAVAPEESIRPVDLVVAPGAGGSWLPPTALTSSPLIDLGAGDLDGDGRADLVTVEAGGHEILLFRGNGDGTFSRLGTINIGFRPDRILVADFAANGLADVIVISWALRKAVLYVSCGPFAFERPTGIGLPQGGTEVWADPLNDHPGSELVWVISGQPVVWSFTAKGQVIEWKTPPDRLTAVALPSPPYVWADLNADGMTELVYYKHNPGELVLIRDSLHIEIGITPGRVSLLQLAAADVDGNSRVELIGLDGTGRVHVLKLEAH